ncbi:AAA family ATPase [Plasmodium gonderi]|uniref:AAA family ATPase n=1 Tax=Plasmodium gonderi TaxID=77519 RepID=A0A1Y1JHM6_PLAGO|nr:AAA family ATPase [Plasmodium gonderi]GAW81158.1 AAA family ATPase [Plasmodium gonderi]
MNLKKEKRIPLCCEICLKDGKDVSNEIIKTAAHKWLFSLGITITLGRHDPEKINCEKLNKCCDYIIIEPAVPIKIVKEVSGNYENGMYGKLCTTHYSIYDTSSCYDADVNETNSPDHKLHNWPTFHPMNHEGKKEITTKNTTVSSEINLIEINKTNHLNSQKGDSFSNGINNTTLVGSLAVPQNIVYSSSPSTFISNEIKNKECMQTNPNLLFTVPMIGDKSVSSMEDDPIILPNFCCIVNVVTYYKNDDLMEEQFNEPSENGESQDEEEYDEGKKKKRKDVPIFSQYILPHLRFHKLWDSLYYEENIKRDLLEYVSALMLFATKKIDRNLINYNHLVLLYGPPGTGKTSLCKALANKICIRLSNIYATGVLIELNAHTLFSKWFSESGKQVLKLFNKIKKIINDYGENDIFICLLIDEVESLSADRRRSMDSSEPSDTIRVVNTLLTQIDSLKYYHNTLILTTSNISEMIDDAFIDRVDLKQYIGLPNEKCRYEIYKDCIDELVEKGIIDFSSKILNYEQIQRSMKNETDKAREELIYGLELMKCSRMSEGFSGRCMRRIPFQAYAYFCQATLRFYNSTNNSDQKVLISLMDFLIALKRAIQKEVINKDKLLHQRKKVGF